MFYRGTRPDADQICRETSRARPPLEPLRRYLPCVAHPRGRLRAALARASRNGGRAAPCRVVDIFDAGEGFGLMCRIEVEDGPSPSLLVTPIGALSFERRNPIARVVEDYGLRRAQRV